MSDPAAAIRQALARGHPSEALRIAGEQAIARPTDAAAGRVYATLASEVGDPEAERAWRRVLALLPDDPEAHYMLGNIAGEQGNYDAAAEHFRAALARAPKHPQLRASLGLALEELGRPRDAESCFREALAEIRDPPSSLLAALARNLFRQHRYTDALVQFDALHRKSGIADPAFNAAYAVCLGSAGRDGEADALFRRAIADAPTSNDIARDYAAFMMRRQRYLEAATLLEGIGASSGTDLLATSMLLICRLQLADWHDLDALRVTVEGRVRQGPSAPSDIVPAYDFLSICDDALLQRRVAARWANSEAHAAPSSSVTANRKRDKLRLGFVSSDYKNHPVGRLVVGLLEHLDRSRFEISAYATSDAGDSFGTRIETAVDRFRPLDVRNIHASVHTLASDAIEILFDLNGFSGGEAIRIFAQRPAPVQINFLGYTGTLGIGAYDFIITDRYCVPPENSEMFAERLLYVEPCYLPSDPARRADPLGFARSDYGLPDDGLVFCAFAAIYKIVPRIFDAWMEVIGRIPGSVLWLRHMKPDRAARLRRAASERGIDGDRLVFAPAENIDRYLARFTLADLFLDSHPFGSHTTVNDALFMGLPAVTIAGRSFASRASASQLNAAGLSDLIAQDVNEYIDLAVSLATSEHRLHRARKTLAHSRARLFDMTAYARAFEAAVTQAWRTH